MKNPLIVIIDYGVGNTRSVLNAIQFLGYKNVVISNKEIAIKKANALILPGVGAFEQCLTNLKNLKLDILLNEEVIVNKKLILGICVGMQLMSTYSEEMGIHYGLDWIKGSVKKIDTIKNLAVPHVGWNDVISSDNNILLNKISENPNFYFDHSYHFVCDEKSISGYCNYGSKITAVVQKENIFGVQFHPEKSQNNGLKLFRNFFNLI